MAKKLIVVYYDTQVPGDHGWAYRCYADGREDSGPLQARRSSASRRLLEKQARSACGVARTRTPVEIKR